MAGEIEPGEFVKKSGEQYDDWLCKQEVSKSLDMRGKPWDEVVAKYPSLTTAEMMQR